MVMLGHHAEAPLSRGFNPGLASESCPPVLAAGHALLVQGTPGLEGAIGLAMVPVHSANSGQQPRIGLDARARRPRPPVVEPAAGDAQHPAQHGNPELRVVVPDELVPHGSSFAKYAAAFFRMARSSVTCLSSRFRRSSSFCSSRGLRPGPRKALAAPAFCSCACHL